MTKVEDFPKAVQRRFEFIDWKLFWDFGLRRSGLVKAFGISVPQASVDVRNYQLLWPKNAVYDAREKAYVPAGRFQPRALQPSANRLLLQLRAYLMGAIGPEDLWFDVIPSVDGAPDIVRSIDPNALRSLLTAMRRRQSIEIEYQSLTSSRRRIIAPHALAFDGHRWHVRALCCEHDDYRDFVITRISEFGAMNPVAFDPQDDLLWNQKIALCLVPHPGLDLPQRQAIECDYGMVDGRREIQVRLALCFYFMKRLNLDLEQLVGAGKISPARLQIALQNFNEVEAAMAKAAAESGAQVRARKALRAMG
jgi:hypothetical protein